MLSNETLKIPSHIAIVMDGNRRWAQEKGLKEIEGHQLGVERIKELVKESAEKGVKSITFWAFSTENWKRSQEFLDDIFELFRYVLENKKEFFDELMGSGGQIHILGDLSKFPTDIAKRINYYLALPQSGKKLIDVNFALNYGGRDELVRAFRKITDKGYEASQINEELVTQFLDTVGQPDVDLMIRTGGEQRTSGFLSWQLNYAELYFTKVYFPDFDKNEFAKALEDYSHRQRRFGGDVVKIVT